MIFITLGGIRHTFGFPWGWIGYDKRMQPRTLMLPERALEDSDSLWATSMAALEP